MPKFIQFTEPSFSSMTALLIIGSVNWMNLGISKEEEIIFESLSDDLYKGLSGIGIALLKYYEINKNLKDMSRLKKIL